jgi:hypothetical protein
MTWLNVSAFLFILIGIVLSTKLWVSRWCNKYINIRTSTYTMKRLECHTNSNGLMDYRTINLSVRSLESVVIFAYSKSVHPFRCWGFFFVALRAWYEPPFRQVVHGRFYSLRRRALTSFRLVCFSRKMRLLAMYVSTLAWIVLSRRWLTFVKRPSRNVKVLNTNMQLHSGPTFLPGFFQATNANPISTMSPVLKVLGSFSTYLASVRYSRYFSQRLTLPL